MPHNRSAFSPDELRQVIDLLSLYKLNVLHLHLTDDQAQATACRAVGRDPEEADLGRLQLAADSRGCDPPLEAMDQVRQVRALLTARVVPHEGAEEELLYPSITSSEAAIRPGR